MSSRWRDVLKIHPAVELFPPLDAEELRRLGEDIRKHGLREPVVVVRQYRRREGGTMDIRDYDLVLIDGRNRLDALQAAGFVLVRDDGKLDPTLGHKALGLEPLTATGGAYAEIEFDNDADIYAFVVSRNLYRRHLTAKQKRNVIAGLLKATPEKSDRQIAETVKVDHKTVASVRAEKEATGEISPVEKRVGKDRKARKQPATHTPAKPKAAAKSEKPEKPESKELPAPSPRDDIGADSASERQRKDVELGELRNAKRQRDIKVEGLESEIAEQEHEIKRLRNELAKLRSVGPVLTLAEKLRPIIKKLQVEGRKNMATMSPATVAILASELAKLVAEWTDKYPNKAAR